MNVIETSAAQWQPSRIAVFGLGYVGCVSAACLSGVGHQVTGVDKDISKVRAVLDGKAPFYEPGLAEAVREARDKGNLRATTSVEEAIAASDIALLCVGTPSEKNGNINLSQLQKVAEEIGGALRATRPADPYIVVVRSTVFPGTGEDVVLPALHGTSARIVSNPEFLREGTAMQEFLKPALTVVGGSDPEAVAVVGGLYTPLGVAFCAVSLRTAEMIKYACNAFHAVKICFANEIGSLSHKLGVSGEEVMLTLCQDKLLNVSSAYLRPGFAYGGSCLPKDLRALNYRARSLDVHVPLLESASHSNEEHLRRAVRLTLDLPQKKIGFFGLAFKENTDDLRESPVIHLLEQMIGKGRDVRVWDPHIQIDQIYGQNQAYVLQAIPHIGKLCDRTLEDLLGWAEVLVLVQKPSAELQNGIDASGIPVVNLNSASPVPASV